MKKKQTLHITNGTSLTNYLQELDFDGEFLSWQEMLCEGPTTIEIDSTAFLEMRKVYLSTEYDIEIDEYEFKTELNKLTHLEHYSEIVLWFEYDLFCHINLIAVISHLKRKKNHLPLYLVCSGRIKGESDFKGLSELNPTQLMQHYDRKILLSKEDENLANDIWELYCGKDHNLIKPYISKTSSFMYLNSCLKAHLKRFPDSKTGLCRLEQHILETIKLSTIKSKNHLLGYVLHYQGYYGFGDIQLQRMINKLSLFFYKKNNQIVLNKKGYQALSGTHNFKVEINNNISYGGLKRQDYEFDKKLNRLVNSNINVA